MGFQRGPETRNALNAAMSPNSVETPSQGPEPGLSGSPVTLRGSRFSRRGRLRPLSPRVWLRGLALLAGFVFLLGPNLVPLRAQDDLPPPPPPDGIGAPFPDAPDQAAPPVSRNPEASQSDHEPGEAAPGPGEPAEAVAHGDEGGPDSGTDLAAPDPDAHATDDSPEADHSVAGTTHMGEGDGTTGEHGEGDDGGFNIHPKGWLTKLVEIGVKRFLRPDEAKLHDMVPAYEALLFSILIVILLAGGAFLLTRNLTRVPSRTQALLEMIVQGLETFVMELIGPHGKRFVPLASTAFIFIATMNLMGLVPGMKSPTANINITAGMALVAVIYSHYHGIRANGLKGYLLHFVGEPWWLGPLNIMIHGIGELAKVLSLTIRLFGNIFGEDMVIVILIGLSAKFLPVYLPIPLQFPMLLLAIFSSFVQAAVYTILTCVYISLFTEHEAEHFQEHHSQTPQAAPA